VKILMIDYEYSPLGGGGGVFNRQIAEELSKRHEITVITSRFGELPADEISDNVRIRRVAVPGRVDRNVASLLSMFGFFPASLMAGMKILKRERYDLIHSFFAIPSALPGMFLARLFKIPHLVSILGGDIYDPSKTLSPHCTPLLKQTVARILNSADKVISLSSDIKNRAKKYYSVSKPIDVIHLGIPEPVFPKMERADFGLAENEKILITIGRLVTRKGVDELIGIVKELEDPMIRLVIIGDGPERRNLEQCADDSGISKQIRFLGNVSDEDKFALLKLADLYVSTSVHEGFGIVFLEAMAASLPVICYDKGGQTDFLKNGLTGSVIPLGGKREVARAIGELFEDHEHRHAIQKNNRDYVNKFFIGSCAAKYEQWYDHLVSPK
jgi:glycosyltransferase involved in cell wall biosynthesis